MLLSPSDLHGEEVSFVFSTNHIESAILKSDSGPDQMYLIGYVLDFLERDCNFDVFLVKREQESPG